MFVIWKLYESCTNASLISLYRWKWSNNFILDAAVDMGQGRIRREVSKSRSSIKTSRCESYSGIWSSYAKKREDYACSQRRTWWRLLESSPILWSVYACFAFSFLVLNVTQWFAIFYVSLCVCFFIFLRMDTYFLWHFCWLCLDLLQCFDNCIHNYKQDYDARALWNNF